MIIDQSINCFSSTGLESEVLISISLTHPGICHCHTFPPQTFGPSMPTNSGSAANEHSAPLSPACQARGHKHSPAKCNREVVTTFLRRVYTDC